MATAWIVPAGLKTPGPIESLAEDALQFASRYVRLAGPLQSNKVIPIHSYGGTMTFGGSISLGGRDLMTVTVDDPHIAGSMLLRGTTYDQYESGGWVMGERTNVSLPDDQTKALQDMIAAVPKDSPQPGTLVPLHIQMDAKTVAGTVVYVPGQPVSTDRSLQVQVPADSIETRSVPGYKLQYNGQGMTDAEVAAQILREGETLVAVDRDQVGKVEDIRFVKLDKLGLLKDAESLDPGGRILRYESYAVTGYIPATTPDQLRAAGTAYPGYVVDDYLQLPSSVPMRVRDLATRTVAGAQNPFDKAVAIQDFLRKNYGYDLNVPETPPGRDTVDFFLFDTLRGYFDYHASAMVVMLRSQGIPARLALGFAVDDTDRNGSGAYVVKDKNSYTWPEVYFPGVGWVPFNPTPDRGANLTPRVDATPLFSGTDHNILKDVPAALNGNNPTGGDSIDPSQPAPSQTLTTGSGDQPLKWYVSAAVTAFLAALVGAVMLGWQRSVAGLPYPQQIWEKTVRLASWGGLRPQPGQTPHDYARRLAKRFRDVEADMPTLANAYAKSRFGHKELSSDEIAAIKDAWPEVRANLVGGITGRLFHRRREKNY
jgi:transglutaminase-like putative cysteine protease